MTRRVWINVWLDSRGHASGDVHDSERMAKLMGSGNGVFAPIVVAHPVDLDDLHPGERAATLNGYRIPCDRCGYPELATVDTGTGRGRIRCPHCRARGEITYGQSTLIAWNAYEPQPAPGTPTTTPYSWPVES